MRHTLSLCAASLLICTAASFGQTANSQQLATGKPSSSVSNGEPARAEQAAHPQTAGGWRKYPSNPVLGGKYGTCFDISVLREGDTYRMWLSWRPQRSVALVQSKDGFHW